MEDETENFVEDNPLGGQVNMKETRRSRRPNPAPVSERWDRAKQTAASARERSELFLRENPVPMILGALIVGLAIGLAIRYGSRDEEKEPRDSIVGSNWLPLPFFWPLFKSLKQKYDESTEAVKEGVRNIDVVRYTKPIRKQWKSWTR